MRVRPTCARWPGLLAAASLLVGCAQGGPTGAATPPGARAAASDDAHRASLACQASTASFPLAPGADSARARKDAERWCGWAQRLERMQGRVEAELQALTAEPGPFESDGEDWSSSPAPDVPATTSSSTGGSEPPPAGTAPPRQAGQLPRLYHERLVLVVARLWIDQATACLVPVGTETSPACGAKAWAAAIESADDLSTFLEQVDLHVSRLRASRSEADRFAYGGNESVALDGLFDPSARERLSTIGGRGKGARPGDGRGGGARDAFAGAGDQKAKASRRSRPELERKREPADDDEGQLDFDAGPPAEGACAPGDPLCGWGGDSTAPALLPPESPAAVTRAPARPRPSGGEGGVRGAVVETSETLLDGVMPVVRSHLGDIGACLPEPTGADATLRLDVRVRVAADGSLRDAQVGPASELPPTAASCVTRVLHDLRVPAPSDGGSHVVTFPLWMANR